MKRSDKMNLEKIKMRKEIWALIGIVLTTFIIQFSDFQLDNYQNSIEFQFLKINGMMERINYYENINLETIILIASGSKLNPLSDEIIEKIELDELRKLEMSFKSKEVSEEEYKKRRIELINRDRSMTKDYYNIDLTILKNLLKEKPKFAVFKYSEIKMAAFIIQTLAISYLLYLYLFMYRLINQAEMNGSPQI